MRKVEMLTWAYSEKPGGRMVKAGKRAIGTGLLHGWATETEDGEHCAVAIIEREDGTVDTHPAHMIRFLDKPEQP